MRANVVLIVSAMVWLMIGAACSSNSSEEEALLAFSAGGSIYTVRADGSGLTAVVHGDRREARWASAPALAPDGKTLAFVRDLGIWVAGVDGEGERLLANVGEIRPSPGASNFSLGTQSLAWSPDGKHLAYVLARVGGSGLSQLWVMRSDGSERRQIALSSAAWIFPTWTDVEHVAIVDYGDHVTVVRLDGTVIEEIVLEGTPLNGIAYRLDGGWLTGALIRSGSIRFGLAGRLESVASGSAPVPSPAGDAVAYLAGDVLRVAALTGGDDNRLVVDLAPLGGADRHTASGCGGHEACSYRPAVISWAMTPP